MSHETYSIRREGFGVWSIAVVYLAPVDYDPTRTTTLEREIERIRRDSDDRARLDAIKRVDELRREEGRA